MPAERKEKAISPRPFGGSADSPVGGSVAERSEARRKNSRQKGARAERELAAIFRAAGFPGAMRGQQRSGLEQADVVGGPDGYHIESKWVEALNVWAAMEQSKRDAGAGEIPVVVMRRTRTPWLAVVPLEVFLALIAEAGDDPAGKRVRVRAAAIREMVEFLVGKL